MEPCSPFSCLTKPPSANRQPDYSTGVIEPDLPALRPFVPQQRKHAVVLCSGAGFGFVEDGGSRSRSHIPARRTSWAAGALLDLKSCVRPCVRRRQSSFARRYDPRTGGACRNRRLAARHEADQWSGDQNRKTLAYSRQQWTGSSYVKQYRQAQNSRVR